jgi:adenosylcobinamide kinase/adenosylcobinamide-phosphate guanylyltransferase
VTNEVGSGIVPASGSGTLFRDLLGRVNARVAARCDDVEMVTCGIPQVLKGAAWTTST